MVEMPMVSRAEHAPTMRATHTGTLLAAMDRVPKPRKSCSSSGHHQVNWSLSAAEPVLTATEDVLSLGEARLSLPNLAPVRVPTTAASLNAWPVSSPTVDRVAASAVPVPVLFNMPQHLQSAFGGSEEAAAVLVSPGHDHSGVQSLGMSSRSSLTRPQSPLQQLVVSPEGEDGTLLSFFGAESGAPDDDARSMASLEVHHFVVQLPRGGVGASVGADVLQQRILHALLRPCGV